MILKIIYWLLIGWWLEPIKFIIKAILKSKNNTEQQNKPLYNKKRLMTDIEKYFYNIITKHFNDKYIVVPQVNLASIVNKEKKYKNEYQNELFRNLDFGIFDKETTSPLLMIEINDKTHNYKKRQYRDIKVKEILNTANINLITFYTEYSNKEDYVINRIKDNLSIQEQE